jgi:hypothetical protein
MLIPNTRLSDCPSPRRLDWSPEIKPGWIPTGIDGLRPVVRWMNVGNTRFSTPMFEDSIARLRLNNAREIETGLSALTSGRYTYLEWNRPVSYFT